MALKPLRVFSEVQNMVISGSKNGYPLVIDKEHWRKNQREKFLSFESFHIYVNLL